jgi:hypothetical protein
MHSERTRTLWYHGCRRKLARGIAERFSEEGTGCRASYTAREEAIGVSESAAGVFVIWSRYLSNHNAACSQVISPSSIAVALALCSPKWLCKAGVKACIDGAVSTCYAPRRLAFDRRWFGKLKEDIEDVKTQKTFQKVPEILGKVACVSTKAYILY